MRVLDIGCGWGGFAIFAAEKYRVEVTGVTVSGEQVKLGQSRCAGLSVYFELKDYRNIEGTFDRIVSIGMFEHVGLLPAFLRRQFPCATKPTLADRFF
jgi:cyclopropane-fatty-acyl-phospholipid synthase